MRAFKKGLALICMLAMVLQLVFAVPVSAEAPALSPGSYDAVFLSDLHNGVGGYLGFKQMMAELKAEGQSPRVLSHGGDYVEDDHGGEPDWQTQVYDVISGTEKETFPDAKQVYTLGNHDFESGTFGGRTDKEAAFEEVFGFPRCGLAYADDELEIYMIGAQGVTGAGGGGEAFIDADIEAFDQYLASKEGSGKVIFLQTHWPGHSSYNFKQRVVTNADKVIDVMNKYGDDMDLVWIWGHNHYEDAMRYVILQPGDEIMYAADTGNSTWGNPVDPHYKTIKFTYANAGCMNDMWWHHDGHNDTSASNNYRGPSACLSVAVQKNDITFTYNRIKQDDDGNWVFSHDANLQIYNHNTLMEHPANVVVDRVTADHTHEYEVSEVVAPTCTEKGYTVEKCKLCDRTRNVDPTDALGHAWDEGVETVPPTVEKAGQMTYTCTRCGATRTARIPRLPGGSLTDIDFTDPADEGKFDVENKDTAAIVEGTGLTLTPTADAFEPIGGGFGGGEATPSAPKDLIKVPVNGDWTATVKVDYDQNAVQYAFSSYFSILAMQDEDYQNLVGIRGTNNVFQDYLRQDGTVATPTVAAPGWQDTPTSGFTATGTYWLRLDKDGTGYTGSWSADGESYTELFQLEDTGIDADYLVLDAYKTSTWSFGGDASWLFTLKTLEFEGGGETPPPPAVDKAALNKAIADAEAVDTGKYTDETVAALNAALADAKAAKSSDDQAVVDAAAAALNAAIAALELRPVEPPPPVGETDYIDFTNPADAEKFAVINKDTAEIAEGEGLTLEWTADAFEPVSAGWGGEASPSTPKDLIRVPVSGDWTATLRLELDRSTVNFAFSSYFAFLAMQGDDYQNMVGVRASNSAAQDFLRENGTITAGAMDSQSVFASNGPYWFRIEKEGTTYTCTMSTDGVEYSDLFVFEDTGIEADYLVIDAYKTSSASFGGTASYQFQLKRLDVEKPAFGEAWVQASAIEAGKQYVVVADGAYAMTNEEVPGKSSYASASTTRGAAAVEIADGKIVSEVTDGMIWTFEEATSAAAYDGLAQYWLVDADGKYLRRGSMSQRNAALLLDEARTANARYYTWSFKEYDDGDGYAMYVNSERAYGSDYPGRVAGDSAGFDIPGTLEHRDPESPFAFMDDGVCSHITLYEKVSTKPAEKPAVASISVDGAAIEGFEPKLRAYAVAVPEGGSAPTVSAEPGNADTVIEVAQAAGVPGEAVITATSPRGVKTYVVGFDYPPKDEYFADGALNEGQWTILNEVKDPTEEEPFKYYRLEKGMGLVMPTQHNSIYQKATPGAWSNMFTMSGGGDWEVVAKAFYPAVPQGNYQQVQFIAWQDEDNYVRINCQDSRQRIEPFYEKNGTAVNQNANALNNAIAAAEDGTMTMYFKINKTGSTYTISYSEDAKEWKSGGVYEAALTNVKVAVFCTQDYQPTQSNYLEPVELAFEYVSVNGLNGETVRTDDEMLVWAAQNAADYIAAGLPDEASDLFAICTAPHGYDVTLSSSDPDVISEAGFVTPAAADKNVDVTVTVSQGDVSASATKTIRVPGTGAPASGKNIDFTDPADAVKFTVDNQTVSEIQEGTGFYMISTNESFEDCKGQLSGDAAHTPRDTVQVPVEGDWTATLYVKVDTSGSNGQYEFLCLYGMADYDNGVGIRAGNGSTVNFKAVNGVNESSTTGMKVQTGLSSGTDHWYRLEKVGTTYTGYLSADGETFEKVFTYEDTGIEAQMIVIDAYSGRSVGYQYWLQSLTFEGEGEEPEEPIDPSIPIWENTQYSFAERAADLIARMSLAQKGSQLITTPAAAIPASSLGGGALNVAATKDVPSYYWWCEALHGYNRLDSSSKGVYARNHEYEGIGQWGPDNAVSYPMSLTVGNTWNPDLYYTEALEVGDEIRELTSRNPSTGNAIDLNFYSPTVNLQRDPRWGRNEESYSEDPYLTVRMASQYVLGMEGKDQSGNLLDPDGYYNAHSTIKHYLANNSEANRTNGGAVSSLNALRNYYAAPYRGIVKATNISSVMTAYSTFNGEPCSYSSYLMDTLLRQIYGFQGYFTSDCDSVGTMVQHTKFVNPRTGKTLTNVERLATALAHGEDLECIGGYAGVGNYGSYAATMVDAKIQTDKGLFTENTFDVALMRLLTARIATGEFDEDLQLTKDAAARTQAQIAALGEGADISAIPYNQTPERLAILDQVNNEGVVMLQNKDNFLPLSIPASGDYKVVIVGAWQTNMYLGLYSAKSTNSYNHINIQKGITDAIKAKNPDATFTYITSDAVTDADKEAIQAADVCVVVGGANGSYSQEGRDRTSLAMANNQAAMFSQVGKWNPNTVAVMEYQGPLETYTFRDDVKAMLWSSFGGIHKGVGFGNIIVGNVNPSGKLTSTWFRSAAELPPTLDYTLYSTDDQVGRTYMYYEGDGVDYPFGYGLSFTTFEYSDLRIDKTVYDANDTVKVSFKVKNTGSVAGKETAQLYIAQPGADTKVRPIRRLEGFQKVELQPGETKTVTLEVKIPDLAYYNEEDDCTSVDTGAYQVQVGKDSASLGLTADFTVTGAMDVYPETLTVKANAVGDSEKGIEERLIYDVGAEINPQLTVAMNNEKLYGYIIADQQSLIKSMASCPLPEGMTFTYESNRPSVAKVEGSKITAAGPGVATVTVTGTLDGRSVSADFIVYVESKPQALSITLDGEPLEGFEKDKYLYEVEVARGSATPVVAAVAASDGLVLTVKQPASVPGIAEVIVTDPASGASETYQIGIGYKPVSTDFSEGLEAAKAKGWNFFYENSENYAFGEDGLTLTPEPGEFGFDVENPVTNVFVESALGDWVAETTLTPAGAIGKTGATHRDEAGLIVYGDNGTSYRVVYNNRWNASNGVITYQNSRINVYLVVAGNDNNFSIANASVPAGTEKIHLRMIHTGNQCQAQYSTNGTTWTNIGNAEPLDTVLPQVGVFSRGNDFTATFDGLNILKVSDVRPQLAELCLDGETVEGFEPGVYAYNLKLKAPTDHIPVVTAAPAAEDLKVEITQFDAPTGVAKVVVSSDYASATYSIALNYGPAYDYLADGEDGTVKGKGFVPTADAKLTMPAMGTWAVVAKAFIPDASAFDGQSIGISVAESASNSVNINVQGANLLVQPSRTNNGRQSTYGYTTFNLTPAEDGSATVYFMIDKDATSFTLYASADGKSFQRLGAVTVTYVNPTIELRGVQTGENPAAIEYVAVPAEDGFDAAVTDYFAWAAQCAADYIAADLSAETSEALALSPAPHGYTVTLSSSDPAVISADGKVTPAAADQNVAVTVTVSDGAASGSASKTVRVPGAGAAGDAWVKADSIEVGQTYVIVADGQYAMTNRQEGPALRTYAGNATTTLASAPVTVADGKITSAVTDDMLWTVEECTAPAAYDGVEQYFLKDAAGNYLRRGSGSSGQGAQLLVEPNLYSTVRYNTWSFYPYEGEDAYALYANSEREYGRDYPFYVYGNETSFDSPGRAQRDEADPFAFTRNEDCSHITLYVKGEAPEPGPGTGGAYKITAPHVVKLNRTKADAGDQILITGDDTITDVTAQTADGKDIPVEKLRVEHRFSFTMPAADVTVKTYYAADAVSALEGVRQQGNPFIPIYDFNPDTEPHVWEDPDNPGQYRFYFLSSHDMDKNHYCSTNHVLYSCPVDDPFNWTYHGVIVGPENTEHDDILYAPDMGCVEDPSSPTGKYYYYYPCNQSGGRQTMVLRSSRPDGKGDPFTVVNWEDETHNRTTGSIMTFDPSIFVDDDGKVYGYWGGYNSTCHGAQLDPATNYTTAVEGTQLDDMLGDGLRGETFGFYEASSMRKIDGVYVFVYSRQGKDTEPEGANYNQLGYAYSDSPLGPWTFGGIVVDAQGEVLGWPESRTRTFGGGNTHGSLVKLGDQWYVTYHRNVETYARQAMIEPIDVVVNEDGSVKITQAEMTSKGFYVNGLNPYAKVSIGTACFMTGNGKIQPLYEHDVESLPVINLRANSVVGIKYFDFNTEAPKGASTSLKIDLVPKGVDATLNVWLRPQSDLGVTPFSENCIKLGEYHLTADLPKEKITVEIPTPAVDTVDGQWGVFYSFSDVQSNGNIVELYDMQFEFSDHEHDYENTVVAPTCLEGGYTLGKCKVCGKEIKSDYTKALGHAWDEGTVTVAPTPETTGLMTYTCTRCGETMTKKLPREGVILPPDIDFTDPADQVKYEIVNQDTAEVIEGEGVTLTPTADAFEPIGGGFGGGAATESEPKDLIKVPVSGDWTATTRLDYNQNDVQYAFSSYFSMLAMEGEDYQNMAGIRGTNNVFQDYLRTDGTVATPTVSAPGWGAAATSGFTANGPYWLRLEKAGTSYTASWSADGETFAELFKLEDTGIDAEYIVLDAYKTSTFSFGGSASWLFTLKSLTYEDTGSGPVVPEKPDYSALEAAIAAAEAVEKDKYTDETVAAMEAALAAAREALKADKQADVDAAAAALDSAVKALEEKPTPVINKTALRAAIAAAEAINKSMYTDETVAAMEAALAAAREALTADTQAAVDAAAQALNAAVAALELKPVENPDLEEIYRLARQALADAQAAQQTAEAALAAAQAAGGANKEALEAAEAAVQAAQAAAEQAMIQAAAAKAAAEASDRDAAGEALLAAQEAAEAAKQAANSAAAYASAQAAQAAAEAAAEAAQAAQAAAAADNASADAAKQAAQAAADAAEEAKAAALAADAAAAANAAKAAADAADAARAHAAAQLAAQAAEAAEAAAQKAAEEAAKAAANAEADQAAAKAAKEAAAAAQKAAADAKAAAEAAKSAAESSNTAAAEAAADAAAQAAKVADALREVTEAQNALLEAKAEMEANAAAAQAALEAAQAAQAAAEAAKLGAAKYLAKAKLANMAAIAEVPEEHQSAYDDALAAGLAAIDEAKDVEAVEKAREDAVKALNDIIDAYTEPFRFDDVKDDSKYYYSPVYWAYEREPQITTGTSDTLFSPDAPCTRAQVVTFLWRAANQPEPKSDKNPFEDVSADAYYYKAMLWAVEEGIAKGTTETTFRPDQACTRGQIMTFLWRYMDEPAPQSENPFEDVAADAYYADAIAWGAEKNIAKGITETEFRPDDTCTRGQIVTFLYRAMP